MILNDIKNYHKAQEYLMEMRKSYIERKIISLTYYTNQYRIIKQTITNKDLINKLDCLEDTLRW